MRRPITWRSAAAISMLGLAPAIGAAFAVPAGASTYTCAAALGTQCGTFTENAYNAGSTPLTVPPGGGGASRPLPPPPSGGGDSGGLGWAVKDASSESGTPLIAGPNYSPGIDQGTDLTKVEHYGTIPGSPGGQYAIGYWYSIVYTPSGEWTSMCVANPNNPGRDGSNLVLRTCNQQKWQAFLALPISGGRFTLPLEAPLRAITHLSPNCRRRPPGGRPPARFRSPTSAAPPPTPCTAWRTAGLSRSPAPRSPVPAAPAQAAPARGPGPGPAPAPAPAPREGLFPLPPTAVSPSPTPTRGSGRTPTAPLTPGFLKLAVRGRRCGPRLGV